MRNKYHAIKTWTDGIWFDSKREARCYQTLLMRQRAGEITHLARQVPYELQPGFVANDGAKVRPIKYIADFVYYDVILGKQVIVDCKGYRTKEYLLKKKLLLYMLRDTATIFLET